MTPPKQVLELIERFERNLDEYKRSDYKEARVRVVGCRTAALFMDGRLIVDNCGLQLEPPITKEERP